MHPGSRIVPFRTSVVVSSAAEVAMSAIGVGVERTMLGALWDATRMRLLVALANERSVSAAARAIGVTQSTASEHVRVLEVAMGQPLIERLGRGSRLTEAGRVLALRAAEALSALAAGEEEIADLAGLQTGRVALAASWAPGVYLLPYTLECFREKYPGVGLDVEIASTADVVQRLLTGKVQLALIGSAPTDERLASRPFCEDEIVGVAKPGLLPVADGSVPAEALGDFTLLAAEPGSSTQELADEELRAAGVEPCTVWRLGSSEAAKRAAHAGLGFALLSRFAVGEELEHGRLQSFRISGRDPVRRRFHVVRLAGREPTPSETRFLETLWTCCSRSATFAAACVVPPARPGAWARRG
jgi:molybdate transport repressor ModE-like protein